MGLVEGSSSSLSHLKYLKRSKHREKEMLFIFCPLLPVYRYLSGPFLGLICLASSLLCISVPSMCIVSPGAPLTYCSLKSELLIYGMIIWCNTVNKRRRNFSIKFSPCVSTLFSLPVVKGLW